jgi:hypothetical protein
MNAHVIRVIIDDASRERVIAALQSLRSDWRAVMPARVDILDLDRRPSDLSPDGDVLRGGGA